MAYWCRYLSALVPSIPNFVDERIFLGRSRRWRSCRVPGCGDNEMRIATVEISEWSPSVSLVAWNTKKNTRVGFVGWVENCMPVTCENHYDNFVEVEEKKNYFWAWEGGGLGGWEGWERWNCNFKSPVDYFPVPYYGTFLPTGLHTIVARRDVPGFQTVGIICSPVCLPGPLSLPQHRHMCKGRTTKRSRRPLPPTLHLPCWDTECEYRQRRTHSNRSRRAHDSAERANTTCTSRKGV